jgi:hypothetical protein
MEQREQILSTFNITIDMLVQYYIQHLRKSMYKSLMKKCLHDLNFDESLISSILIDEKTTRNEFQLHESGTGTEFFLRTINLKIVRYEEQWVISRNVCSLV